MPRPKSRVHPRLTCLGLSPRHFSATGVRKVNPVVGEPSAHLIRYYWAACGACQTAVSEANGPSAKKLVAPRENRLHHLRNITSRPSAAKLYVYLITLTPIVILLQGFLFGGFNADPSDRVFLDIHLWLGRVSFAILILGVTPSLLLAGFDKATRIAPLTTVLIVLWIIQAGLGEGTQDVRWFSAIHVPLGIAMFVLAEILAGKVHRLARGSSN